MSVEQVIRQSDMQRSPYILSESRFHGLEKLAHFQGLCVDKSLEPQQGPGVCYKLYTSLKSQLSIHSRLLSNSCFSSLYFLHTTSIGHFYFFSNSTDPKLINTASWQLIVPNWDQTELAWIGLDLASPKRAQIGGQGSEHLLGLMVAPNPNCKVQSISANPSGLCWGSHVNYSEPSLVAPNNCIADPHNSITLL